MVSNNKTPSFVKTIIIDYGLKSDEIIISRLGGIANENYLIKTNCQTYVLKIIRDNPSVKKITNEIKYQKKLIENDIPVVSYLISKSGKPFYSNNGFTAVLMKKSPGKIPTVKTTILKQLGLALGKIHSITNYPMNTLSNWYSSSSITANYYLIKKRASKETVGLFRPLFHNIKNVNPSLLPQSIIHGDLFLDNTLFENDQLVAILDWERVGQSASVIDFCITLMGLQTADDKFDGKKFSVFYHSYNSVRFVTEIEKSQFNLVYNYAKFALASWRYLAFNHFQPNQKLQLYYQEALAKKFTYNLPGG